MRLLVIGGTGFIGKHIVNRAQEKGFKTTVISKHNLNTSNKQSNVVYLSADIGNKKNLSNKLKDKDFDCVVNLGGYIDHSDYSSGGSEVFNDHFIGAKNIVDCISRSKLKTFVHVGSSDEYGNNVAPQNEIQRENPMTPYACAKVASTHFLQALHRTENFPAIILRPFLVYGPGQGDDRLIPYAIKRCLCNEKFLVSEGKQLRDFCYIDDFVDAVFLSLCSKKAYGEVINIASGAPISVKRIINNIKSIVGLGVPLFGEIPYRRNENMCLYADISKAKNLLNWSQKFSLNDGLEHTINSYRKE